MADDAASTPAAAQVEPVSAPSPTSKSDNVIAQGESAEATDAMEVDEPAKDTAVLGTENATEDHVDASASPVVNGDSAPPASSKKVSQAKRKSTGGTPAKKLNRKKSMPDLHLNVQPGDFWYVQMKGYPPWPAVICDEDMLPESLLSKRPVSAMRVDGTYREDFEEGGKNVRDRRYPVMFLGTNEFAWQVNTDLAPLDIDELKGVVERNEQGKKTKALWSAYEIAAEEHNLEYFNKMLKDHARHVVEETQRLEDEQEQKLAKKEKKSKKTIDDDGDVAMEDAEDGAEKKKSSKKRKKEAEDDGEKKPKIVLKGLKASAQEDSAPKPKKARKSKGAVVDKSEEPEVKSIEQAPPTEEERLKERQKTIYYLRHKLQKGLVTRDRPPQPSDMDIMDEHLSVLEQHQDLEPAIIKETKVNKLLKVILKLGSIPRDEEFKFKDRCQKLLDAWTVVLNGGDKPAEPSTNGTANGEVEVSEKTESAVNGKTEVAEEKGDKEEVKEDAGTAGAAESSKVEEPVETT